MKPVFTKSLLALLFLGVILITACRNNDDDDDTCGATGTLEASWKVNGVEEKSYVTYHAHTVSFLSLSFQSCSGPNNTVVLNYIPYPPAVGTYELKYGPLSSPIKGMATYIDESVGTSGVSYATNDTITGTFTITAVDLAAKTLSGTFSFDGLKEDGSGVINNITEGQIFNTVYED